MHRTVLLTILLCCAPPALAEVFKCRNAEGALSYSDKPCPTSTQQSVMDVATGGSSGSAAGGVLTPRCDEEGFAPSLSADPDAAQLEGEALLARMTPAHRSTLEQMGYGFALTSAEVGIGFASDGTMHVCARDTPKGKLEIVVLPDGRAVEFNGKSWRHFAESILQSAQRGCGERVRACLTNVDRDLGLCLGAIAACSGGAGDCCPGECLREFQCRTMRGDVPFQAFFGAFQNSCPASVPIADACM